MTRQERLTAQQLLAQWIEARDAKYDSKMLETRGRLAALERVVLTLLELLIDERAADG